MVNNRENNTESVIKNLSGKSEYIPDLEEVRMDVGDLKKMLHYVEKNEDHLDMINGKFTLKFDPVTNKVIKITI